MKQGRTGASKQSPGSTLEEQNHNGISTVRMCPPFPIRSTTCQGRARRVDLGDRNHRGDNCSRCLPT
jgi:hypothetical protein